MNKKNHKPKVKAKAKSTTKAKHHAVKKTSHPAVKKANIISKVESKIESVASSMTHCHHTHEKGSECMMGKIKAFFSKLF